MYGPANKHGNGYTYESSFVHAGGPTHPTPGKSALFTVTSNGTLRMIWSQNTNRVEETTIELESVNSSEDQVTHASFASEKSKASNAQTKVYTNIHRVLTSRSCYKLKTTQACSDRDSVGCTSSSREGQLSTGQSLESLSTGEAFGYGKLVARRNH
jgi:hypothetical protein